MIPTFCAFTKDVKMNGNLYQAKGKVTSGRLKKGTILGTWAVVDIQVPGHFLHELVEGQEGTILLEKLVGTPEGQDPQITLMVGGE